MNNAGEENFHRHQVFWEATTLSKWVAAIISLSSRAKTLCNQYEQDNDLID